jgi:hypothetical protein
MKAVMTSAGQSSTAETVRAVAVRGTEDVK